MIDFATLKSRIKDTAESAGRIAGDMVELTRMKMQVVQYKGELSKAHEKLGAMIYNMMKVDEEDTSAVNVCIDEIDYILDKIQEAEEKVKELRKVSCCQSCGMEIPVDACFCPKCGAFNPLLFECLSSTADTIQRELQSSTPNYANKKTMKNIVKEILNK